MLLATGAEVRTLKKVQPTPEEINKKFDSSAQRLLETMERLEHTADKLSNTR